jgi:hypothetical protein
MAYIACPPCCIRSDLRCHECGRAGEDFADAAGVTGAQELPQRRGEVAGGRPCSYSRGNASLSYCPTCRPAIGGELGRPEPTRAARYLRALPEHCPSIAARPRHTGCLISCGGQLSATPRATAYSQERDAFPEILPTVTGRPRCQVGSADPPAMCSGTSVASDSRLPLSEDLEITLYSHGAWTPP